MRHLLDGPAELERRLGAAAVRGGGRDALHAAARAAAAAEQPPPEIADALAAYRLLHDVPFNVLVADARLVPDESIRFFVVDEEWIDALERGALSVGTVGTREISHAAMAGHALGSAARRRIGVVRAMRVARLGGRTDVTPKTVAAAGSAPVTGFLLRSALVSHWPGLAIRAWATDDPALLPPGADPDAVAAAHPELVVGILRLEQLAPSLLLALFAGTPRTVWLEEPHHGVQFGVDVDVGRTVSLVDLSGRIREDLPTVPLRDRPGAAVGVIDVAALATDVGAAAAGHPGVLQQVGSATLALVLLRPPVRQRFQGGQA